MKFLCLECDRVMDFAERNVPGDGTFGAVFGCPSCGRQVAMLANPMETQLVSSLGVQIGGRTLPPQPLEVVRTQMDGGDAFVDDEATTDAAGAVGREAATSPPGAPGTAARLPQWSPEALDRLANVPSFVRGMVKRIYGEYAAERGIERITPEIMDRARSDLGLEGM